MGEIDIKKLKINEDTIKIFLHRLEGEINFKPNSFANDSFKVINQIQNRKFSMTIDNSNKRFRIELPIIKHIYLRKPTENSNAIGTKEMYARMFALDGKKEQPYRKLYEQEQICRSNSYELDEIQDKMDIVVEEIVHTLKEEVEHLATML